MDYISFYQHLVGCDYIIYWWSGMTGFNSMIKTNIFFLFQQKCSRLCLCDLNFYLGTITRSTFLSNSKMTKHLHCLRKIPQNYFLCSLSFSCATIKCLNDLMTCKPHANQETYFFIGSVWKLFSQGLNIRCKRFSMQHFSMVDKKQSM